MENIFPCCAGWDIHQKSVEACVRRLEPAARCIIKPATGER